MVRICTIFIFTLFLVSCGNDNPKVNKQKGNKALLTKVDLSLNGQELFVKHCKLCHGIDGRLQMNGAKDFKLSELNLEERIVVITEGRNAMTPFKKVLSAAEIKKVAAYTIELTNKE